MQHLGQGPQLLPIGEFGGAPTANGGGEPFMTTPIYWLYELSQAALNPSRAFADAARLYFKSPINPLSFTTFGKSIAAACELFERSTRRYGQPEWGIASTLVGGERVPVPDAPEHGGAHAPHVGVGVVREAPLQRCRAPAA